MDEKLNEIYSTIVTESEKVAEAPVGELEGSEKAQGPKSVETADNKVDAPEEGPSQGEVKKGGACANKEVVEDSFDFKSSASFEELYKNIIGENEDIVSAPDVEGDSFDDDLGDFDAALEDDVDEETDIATELRTMADRLSELADKYGEPEDEMEGEDDVSDEIDDLGGEEDDEDEVFESIKSEPEPKPFDPAVNRAKTAKGKLSSVGKKKAKGDLKGKHTGEPETLGDKKGHTNTKGNTAKASGPAASKKATDAFC